MSENTIIECNNLSVAYENGYVAAKNVSFSIEKGEYIYIVGENGSGKSTLVKAILGLCKKSSGNILFSESKFMCGYLPQYTAIQKSFPATVYEVVLSGCISAKKLFPLYTKQDRKKADNAISTLKINDLVKKSFKNLSGGQRQKVLLARALCCEGNLLILDEPVNGLDPIACEEMYELIDRLHKDGKTILMVSHDIENALVYADKIIHMNKECVFFGTPKEYVSSDVGKAFVHRHCHGGHDSLDD